MRCERICPEKVFKFRGLKIGEAKVGKTEAPKPSGAKKRKKAVRAEMTVEKVDFYGMSPEDIVKYLPSKDCGPAASRPARRWRWP